MEKWSAEMASAILSRGSPPPLSANGPPSLVIPANHLGPYPCGIHRWDQSLSVTKYGGPYVRVISSTLPT